MIVGGATEAIVLSMSECVVPDGLDGPVHLFITNSETPLSSNIVGQDASIIVAGMSLTCSHHGEANHRPRRRLHRHHTQCSDDCRSGGRRLSGADGSCSRAEVKLRSKPSLGQAQLRETAQERSNLPRRIRLAPLAARRSLSPRRR